MIQSNVFAFCLCQFAITPQWEGQECCKRPTASVQPVKQYIFAQVVLSSWYIRFIMSPAKKGSTHTYSVGCCSGDQGRVCVKTVWNWWTPTAIPRATPSAQPISTESILSNELSEALKMGLEQSGFMLNYALRGDKELNKIRVWLRSNYTSELTWVSYPWKSLC